MNVVGSLVLLFVKITKMVVASTGIEPVSKV